MNKRIVCVAVVALCTLPVRAQLLSPEALGGAAVGGLAGGIIGHNSRGRTAEGVGIGAGAGLLLGALWHDAKEERPVYVAPTPVPPAPVYYPPAPVYYTPAPAYYETVRPNYAITGAAIGGVAGGIIGHNQGGHTLEGVGIGAGAGLLLGGVAEQQARRRERIIYTPAPTPYYYTAPGPAPGTASAPAAGTAAGSAPATAQPPASIINPSPGASPAMAGANNLFGR